MVLMEEARVQVGLLAQGEHSKVRPHSTAASKSQMMYSTFDKAKNLKIKILQARINLLHPHMLRHSFTAETRFNKLYFSTSSKS